MFLLCCCCLIMYSSSSSLGSIGYGIYKIFNSTSNFLKNPLGSIFDLKKPAEIGEACKAHTDCKNWGPELNNTACCQGICSIKLRDWVGNGYCPHECVGRFGASPGTCK